MGLKVLGLQKAGDLKMGKTQENAKNEHGLLFQDILNDKFWIFKFDVRTGYCIILPIKPTS